MHSGFDGDVYANVAMKAAPIEKSWIESGDPQASLALLACSDDRAATTILWQCTAGKFTWRYRADETVYFLAGGVVISIDGGPKRRYGAGDALHFSRGSRATWEVETYIRKVAFCRSVLPRPFGVGRRLLRALYHRLRGRPVGLDAQPAFG